MNTREKDKLNEALRQLNGLYWLLDGFFMNNEDICYSRENLRAVGEVVENVLTDIKEILQDLKNDAEEA